MGLFYIVPPRGLGTRVYGSWFSISYLNVPVQNKWRPNQIEPVHIWAWYALSHMSQFAKSRSFLEWWYWKDIWRLELLNKIQFTPWKNEPIFEKLLICHIFCLFFFEQHKKYNGKNGREKRGKHSRVLLVRVIFQKRRFFRENAWGIQSILRDSNH